MNCHDGPWFFIEFGLCFAEDAIFGNEYFVANFAIVIDATFLLALVATIC